MGIKGDTAKLVTIIVVPVIGTALIILGAIVLLCYLRKRKFKNALKVLSNEKTATKGELVQNPSADSSMDKDQK